MDKKKKTPKQIAALVCVGLLLLLYLATVGLPILLWIYIWLFGKIKERRQGQDNSNGK